MNPVRAAIARHAGPAAVVILCSAGLASAQTTTSISAAAIPVRPAVSIDNFGIVNSNYYRGAQPNGDDFKQLAALGVKTIIDLTSDDEALPTEQAQAERAGMRVVKIPMTTRTNPTVEELERFLAVANDPEAQPVYVHCVGGRHRTGVMTAVYRMTNEGWSGEQAFQEMKQYKFGADFLHPEFKKFVLHYEPQPGAVTVTVAKANENQ